MSGFIRRAKRTVYENPWLRFEAHEIVHPNGTPGEHGLVVTPTASAVVVLDGDDVYLTSQWRFGVDREVLEIVKGGASAGESHLQCAQRELREELGLEADRWTPMGLGYEIPSIVQTPVAMFLARDIRFVEAELEAVESIERIRMPLRVALDMVAAGEIDDTLTALALYRASRLP